MIPRGIRNRNPGNLRANGIEWEGLSLPHELTPEQVEETEFCVFRAPWWGIRAMAKVLQNYYRRHGLDTIQKVVERYAPGHENPTNNYAHFVAEQMGVETNDELNLDCFKTMQSLVRAMILFENGADPYTWQIVVGLDLAGIAPKIPEF